jgi:hypothetical protein
MATGRLVLSAVLLIAAGLAAQSAVGTAGIFSSKPKGPQLLGAHPAVDARNARRSVIKAHQSVVPARKLKPGTTAVGQARRPGKTVLGSPVKH